MTTSRQFLLRQRPHGLVKPEDFDFVTTELPELADGELLVAVDFISLDPAMRGWLNDTKSYVPPVQIGEVMRAGGVGHVVASRDPAFAVGDVVFGMTGVQDHVITTGKGWHKVDTTLAPAERWLGALGMPGLTAYFGLFDIGKPKPGETVVVSGAAGATGSVAGQLAKIHGCTVIGIAGGADKCRYLVDELGFDGAVDYKGENTFKRLRELAPGGIDVYFDNVGGDILDIALAQIRRNARIVICGAISQYNTTTGMQGPKNYMSLLVQRARMEGFVVFDYAARYGEGRAAIAKWLGEGKLKVREDVVPGLETFPDTLLRLFRGDNTGKLVLKV